MPIDPTIFLRGYRGPIDIGAILQNASQNRLLQNEAAASNLKLADLLQIGERKKLLDAAARAAYQTPAPVTTQSPSMTMQAPTATMNGVQLPGNTLTLPGSTSTVQGPPQFNQGQFTAAYRSIDPLGAQDYEAGLAKQQQDSRHQQLLDSELLSRIDNNTIDHHIKLLNETNQMLGAVRMAPPEQKQQAYAATVGVLKHVGALPPDASDQYPGDHVIDMEFNQGLTSQQQLQNEQAARTAAETGRHNQTVETETARHNRVTEANSASNNRSNDSRMDKSYQYNASALTKISDPIEQLSGRMGRLQDTLNQQTPQADALVAPELMTVMAGGQGSGLRLNEAEISRVVGGRTNLEALKAALGKWQSDPNKGFAITPAQRQQIRDLLSDVNGKIIQKRQIVENAQQQLISANDVSDHRKIVADARKALADIDAGAYNSGASAGPAAGMTRIQASDGSLHDIPTGNLNKARQIDPNLKVIQ